MRDNAPIEERNCDNLRIAECFEKGAIRVLRNVRLLRVYSTKTDASGNPIAFPPADYPWYERPPIDKVFSILVPLTSRGYFEQCRNDHSNILVDGPKKYDLDFEEVTVDLRLTAVEAAFFQADEIEGHHQILRLIGKPFRWRDSAGQEIVYRTGIHDVVSKASGDIHSLSEEDIANHILESGSYRGTPLKDVPIDYLVRGAVPGGLGAVSPYLQNVCTLELKRRKKGGSQDVLLNVMTEDDEPQEAIDIRAEDSDRCEALNARGERCGNKGTLHSQGHLVCTSHKNYEFAEVEVTV